MNKPRNKIAVIVGSFRRNSTNLILARAIEKLAGSRLIFNYADIRSLPHYDDDLWPNVPDSVTVLKQTIESCDGVLFVTPEYNRSVPGVLKNALDWGSRPYGMNSWSGKPASVIGTSPGVIGSAVAQSHLRSILPVLELTVSVQPEVYFQSRSGLIDENMSITDAGTKSFLEGWLTKFESFISTNNRIHGI
jgi:chromate reductase, NAD(P)H dehydrogenase (quinone)